MIQTELRLKLEQVIDKFIEENCEKPYWPETYVSGDLHVKMADAALSVLNNMGEYQKYLIDYCGFKNR